MLVASSASAAAHQYSECSHHHNNQQNDNCDDDGNDADSGDAADDDKHFEHCSLGSNTMAVGVACIPNSTLKQTEKEKSYDKKTSTIKRDGVHAVAGEINSILREKGRDKSNSFEKVN